MGYDKRDYMVRVDFFKPSGNSWYTTEAVDMQDIYNVPLIHDAVLGALEKHLKGRLRGMTAVVLEPYHQHSHPLMLQIPE